MMSPFAPDQQHKAPCGAAVPSRNFEAGTQELCPIRISILFGRQSAFKTVQKCEKINEKTAKTGLKNAMKSSQNKSHPGYPFPTFTASLFPQVNLYAAQYLQARLIIVRMPRHGSISGCDSAGNGQRFLRGARRRWRGHKIRA
jgi:hypothetical protein